MKALSFIAVILIMGGVVSLAYQGIRYTTQEKALSIGPLQVTTEHSHTIPLPPIIGVVSVIGGIILLVAASKST